MTVQCPSCRATLRIPQKIPVGKIAAKCPKCRSPVPLSLIKDANSTARLKPVPPAADEANAAADHLTITSASSTHPDLSLADFPFLEPAKEKGELGRLGSYRILEVLGTGGMGAVFRAEDIHLERHVALKVMLPQFANEAGSKARFMREARAQAAVEHDHIIPIFQVGEDRNVPFIAMPLLKGEMLSTRLQSADGKISVLEAVRIAREIAEGLAAAHDKGLIHRDIKPGNIWLEGNRCRVKILDFGLARAKVVDKDDVSVTQEGAIVGTPAYMSPEQARSLPLDAQSDLFSLGAVLYQMVTGELPFAGKTTMAVLTSLAVDTPPSPRDRNPEVPPALERVIYQLLEKDPQRRPASAAATVLALANVEAQMLAVPLPEATLPGTPIPTDSDPWSDIDVDDHTKGRPRPRATTRVFATAAPIGNESQHKLILGLIGLVAVLLGLVVILLTRNS